MHDFRIEIQLRCALERRECFYEVAENKMHGSENPPRHARSRLELDGSTNQGKAFARSFELSNNSCSEIEAKE